MNGWLMLSVFYTIILLSEMMNIKNEEMKYRYIVIDIYLYVKYCVFKK